MKLPDLEPKEETMSTAATDVLDTLWWHYYDPDYRFPLNPLWVWDRYSQPVEFWRTADKRLQCLSTKVHKERLRAEDREKRK